MSRDETPTLHAMGWSDGGELRSVYPPRIEQLAGAEAGQ